jgi:hypothetical protein
VSHGKIRTEKVCLNCGTETTGRFCPVCGQENIEPKQTVWHLINHFFSDLTHFDGKFFITVKDLFAKPGFLSREYMLGRRASYLDPIRMYIFTSAIFFLIFFSIFNVEKMDVRTDKLKAIQKDPDLRELLSKAVSAKDSLMVLRNYNQPKTRFAEIPTDSTGPVKKVNVNIAGINYSSIEEYELAQKLLPVSERDGWFNRKIKHRLVTLNKRYENEPGGLIQDMIGKFMHNSPKALFISLPVFALLLKLLYVRRRQFYYVDHGIFAVHLYIYSFLVLLVLFGLNTLHKYTGLAIFNWIFGFACLYPFIYYYKAMRRFYAQSRWKTVLKYFMLLFLSFIVQVIIFAFAFAFSALEV